MRFRDPSTRESDLMSVTEMMKETIFGREMFVAIIDSTAQRDGVILRSGRGGGSGRRKRKQFFRWSGGMSDIVGGMGMSVSGLARGSGR